MTGLQPVALPSGSSVRKSPATKDGRRSSFLSKSSGLSWHHQKRPFFRQHFLKRLPLPHGQRSLRPSFSSSSLSPLTIRTPRLTCVSDGNPFRRLLIVSKKMAVRRSCVWTWDTSIRDTVRKENRSVLARNRTWSSTFAESRAYPAHSKDITEHAYPKASERRALVANKKKQPTEESNPVLQNRNLPCDPAHSQAVLSVARPGIEPAIEHG